MFHVNYSLVTAIEHTGSPSRYRISKKPRHEADDGEGKKQRCHKPDQVDDIEIRALGSVPYRTQRETRDVSGA